MNRRTFLGTVTASLALGRAGAARQEQALKAAAPKGRLKQGVTRGVFGRGVPLEDCCRQAASVGIQGFDLVTPPDWPVVKKYGLVPSMASGGGGSIASVDTQGVLRVGPESAGSTPGPACYGRGGERATGGDRREHSDVGRDQNAQHRNGIEHEDEADEHADECGRQLLR